MLAVLNVAKDANVLLREEVASVKCRKKSIYKKVARTKCREKLHSRLMEIFGVYRIRVIKCREMSMYKKVAPTKYPRLYGNTVIWCLHVRVIKFSSLFI